MIATPYTYDILSVNILVEMANLGRAVITNQGVITLVDGKNVIKRITVRSEYMNFINDTSNDLVYEMNYQEQPLIKMLICQIWLYQII